jgi:hypothetical protein
MIEIGVPVKLLNNSSWTIIYVAGGAFAVGMVHVTNISMVVAKVRLCLVQPAGVPSINNALFWDLSIQANSILELLAGDVWSPGYTLQGLTNVNFALNVKVGGALMI